MDKTEKVLLISLVLLVTLAFNLTYQAFKPTNQANVHLAVKQLIRK